MAAHLRIIFAGTPEFAVPALNALIQAGHTVCAVYTQPDRPAGRGRKLQFSAVKKAALAQGLPVYQPPSLKDQDTQQALFAHGADIMIVAAYGLILPVEIIEHFPLGCLNIHASLLPRWRGAAPIQRAIMAGDAVTGITIMQMDEGLDTGDMWLKMSLPIHPDSNASDLHDQLAELGATALLHTLKNIQAGTGAAEPQDNTRATYAHKLEKQEAVIDWHEPAINLARKVRALCPWPIAETRYQNQKLRIWQATSVDVTSSVSDGKPGDIITAGAEGIDVLTGKGLLRLQTLQLPGKKPVSAADFLNARSVDHEHLG